MAARVTQHVLEVIQASVTHSPTTPTGAGVTQHVLEVIQLPDTSVRVTQHVVEVIVGAAADGSHGDSGGGGTTATTHTFGYAV